MKAPSGRKPGRGSRPANKTGQNAPPSLKKATGSIAHATDILLRLSDDVHSLTDIARQCHLSKSTTHRVLKLLERSRLVVEDNITRRYYLGPLLKKLASNPAAAHQRLITCALDELKRLSRTTEETVAMDAISGVQCIPLHEIPSPQDLKVTEESKKADLFSSRFYAGANVKALLTQLEDEKLKIILDHISIPQETDRTVTDKALLKAQIDEVGHKGYAITYGERIPGSMCISMPVRNYFIPVVLSVIGPEIRLQPRAKEVLAEVKLSAGRISASVAAVFGKANR